MISGSRVLLLFLFISFVISGIIDGRFPQLQVATSTIHSIFIAVLLFNWCGKHAHEHNISSPRGSKTLCGLLGFNGVPLYLFRSFGFKQGGAKCLIGLIYMKLTLTAYLMCTVITGTYFHPPPT